MQNFLKNLRSNNRLTVCNWNKIWISEKHLHFFEKSPILRSFFRSASLLHSLYSTSKASKSVSRFNDCPVTVPPMAADVELCVATTFDLSEQHTINLFKRCVRALIELFADIFVISLPMFFRSQIIYGKQSTCNSNICCCVVINWFFLMFC